MTENASTVVDAVFAKCPTCGDMAVRVVTAENGALYVCRNSHLVVAHGSAKKQDK